MINIPFCRIIPQPSDVLQHSLLWHFIYATTHIVSAISLVSLTATRERALCPLSQLLSLLNLKLATVPTSPLKFLLPPCWPPNGHLCLCSRQQNRLFLLEMQIPWTLLLFPTSHTSSFLLPLRVWCWDPFSSLSTSPLRWFPWVLWLQMYLYAPKSTLPVLTKRSSCLFDMPTWMPNRWEGHMIYHPNTFKSKKQVLSIKLESQIGQTGTLY